MGHIERAHQIGRALAAAPPDELAARLAELTDEQRAAAIEALTVAANLLVPDAVGDRTVIVRPHRDGDLGWIASRNGAVYADEFGWTDGYEALCAQIVAEFDRDFAEGRDRAFIAEVDGARAGCALVRQRTDDEAQIRLVLTERWARGLGLGRRLVGECIEFARAAGYSSVMLWTNDVLDAARHIYEAFGFELVEEDPHHSFGHDLVGQVWRLDL